MGVVGNPWNFPLVLPSFIGVGIGFCPIAFVSAPSLSYSCRSWLSLYQLQIHKLIVCGLGCFPVVCLCSPSLRLHVAPLCIFNSFSLSTQLHLSTILLQALCIYCGDFPSAALCSTYFSPAAFLTKDYIFLPWLAISSSPFLCCFFHIRLYI